MVSRGCWNAVWRAGGALAVALAAAGCQGPNPLFVDTDDSDVSSSSPGSSGSTTAVATETSTGPGETTFGSDGSSSESSTGSTGTTNTDPGDKGRRLRLQVINPVPAALEVFPVLLELHPGDIDFMRANEDLSGLHFQRMNDNQPLAFQVERFEHEEQKAQIWIEMPYLGPMDSEDIWMFYGGGQAPDIELDMWTVYQRVHHFEGGDLENEIEGNNGVLMGDMYGEDDALIGGGADLYPGAKLSHPVDPGAQPLDPPMPVMHAFLFQIEHPLEMMGEYYPLFTAEGQSGYVFADLTAVDGAHALNINIYDNDGDGAIFQSGYIEFGNGDPGEWHHFAVTWMPFEVFIDSVPVTLDNQMPDGFPVSEVLIGHPEMDPIVSFEGMIDEYRVTTTEGGPERAIAEAITMLQPSAVVQPLVDEDVP